MKEYAFGWFSTGRDEAARKLLVATQEAIEAGQIPARIEFVFLNRTIGEGIESDTFMRVAAELRIPQIGFSSRRFEPNLRAQDLAEWRRRFDQHVTQLLASRKADCLVLAGYMLIVSEDLCNKYLMVNLHPALPGGPIGTWEQVIDALIRWRAPETGLQIHRVSSLVDRGPAISFCRFPIPSESDSVRLRTLIRSMQVERETPLLVLTLRAISSGEIQIPADDPPASDQQQTLGRDLTSEVEAFLEKEELP